MKKNQYKKLDIGKPKWLQKSLLIIIAFAFIFLPNVKANRFVSNAEMLTQQKETVVIGKVTDEKGEPLPGASIVVKGTTNGVATNIDGNYTISINEKAQVLVFSFVGMVVQEVTYSGQKTINIQLESDKVGLEEVVVVGYGVKKKINLSGAVAAVGDDYFKSRPIVNVGQALQGAMGNVSVTQTASPNAIASFNVRGTTSLSGGEPLIIIDGVTSNATDLGRMNPNDIASVSVLKDAASASIYGSRASFGVILVTTKVGVSEKLQINVNANASWRKIGRSPDLEMDPYLVANFKDIMGAPWYDLYSDEDLEYAKKVSAGEAEPTRINPTNENRYQYFHKTNWRNVMLKKFAETRNVNMNISQKIEKGNFYVGLEAVNNEGLYKVNNDIHKRYNMRSNVSFDLTNWLTVKNNIWIYNNKYDESNATGSSFLNEIMTRFTLDPLYNPDGSKTYSYARMIGRLESGNYTTIENTYQTKFSVEMKFLKDRLKIMGDASFKRFMRNREAFDKPVTYSEGPGHSAITGSASSWARFENWAEDSNNYNLFATYTDTYNEKHFLNVLVGYNQEEFLYNNTSGKRSDLISPGLPTAELATGDQVVGQSKYAWAVQGIFGRLNYIYADKYILEANVRYDGSSRFPKNDRWVMNPSASVSWIASKESFLKESFLDLLKFRASYGSLGNQNVGPYPYIANLGTGDTSSLFGGKKAIEVSSPGLVSPSLTWETVVTKNIGVDVAVLNNRLHTSFDYYHRNTSDMLTSGKELPSVLGTSVPTENAADLVTKGWEFSLGWKDQVDLGSKPLRYSVNFNLSDSRAWIKKFDNPTGSLGKYYVDREIGEIWGYVSDGYYQTQEEIDLGPNINDVASYPSTRGTLPGDIKFKDLNGDGSINTGNNTLADHGDRKIIGNSRARYNFGLDLSASWNGFDLRAFFQGVGKKDYYPGSSAARTFFWGAFGHPWSSVTKENLNNHWTPTNRNAFYPRPKAYVAEGGKEVSLTQTRWLQNAAYVRMKNVTLGYTIPAKLSDRVGINSLRFYVSGENLFEITKLFKYLDPENLVGNGYPFQRTYSVGVSLNF